jgi:MOSC domain-containing protein YiiM
VRGEIVQVSTSSGGVPKRAVAQAEAGPLGLAGDIQKNRKYHGGPRQALLLVAAEDVDRLVAAGWPLYYGALGENITTRGLDFRQVRHGQRFQLGGAIVEITKRRTPCATLDVYGRGIQSALFDAECKRNDPSSPVWGMAGFYAAVVQPGPVRPGDAVILLPA